MHQALAKLLDGSLEESAWQLTKAVAPIRAIDKDFRAVIGLSFKTPMA